MYIKIIKEHNQLTSLGINVGDTYEVKGEKKDRYLILLPRLNVTINVPKEYCEAKES